MSISKFKATCLAVLEEVRTSGEPILITKRGKPIAEVVPPSTTDGTKRQLGMFGDTITFMGDVISPLDEPWEVLEK